MTREQDSNIHLRDSLCRPLFLWLAATFAVIIFIFNGLPKLLSSNLLEHIQAQGELVVLTRNSPTTYYEGADGPAGLDYDLAKMFADELGVELTMIVPDTLGELLDGVIDGSAHFAAAGLTVTEPRKAVIRFGPSYQDITQQLVYLSGQRRPRSLAELNGESLEIVATSSHAERLEKLKPQYPNLSWKEVEGVESEELLELVSDGVIDYTIADSNEVTLNKRFLLDLRVAFNIGEPEQTAWAFEKNGDNSLYDAAVKFFEKIKQNGDLTRLIERSYGHVENLDYVGTRFYRRHIAQRLPTYRRMFEEAAEIHDLDWRLVAAVGYQESLWNPDAVSFTGVRGIMMLTNKTARQLGVKNRRDPESSIRGGAEYIAKMIEITDEDIPEPDRTWFALASYNVGYYHVADARIIAKKLGKNPNRWYDLKEVLPLLAKKKWYKQTRHGYARGREPVRYVENIRSYYDILRWVDENETNPGVESEAFSIIPNVP